MEKKSTPKVILNLKSLRKTNENLHIWKWFFSNGLKGDIKIITGYGTVIFIWGVFWLKANDRYFCRFRKMVDYHQYVFHFSRAGQCSNFNKTSDNTAQKMKFSIKDLFSKCDQIRGKLPIWSHLLKKSLTEKFIFCAV